MKWKRKTEEREPDVEMKCVCEQLVMGVIVPPSREGGPHPLPQHVQQLRPHHGGQALRAQTGYIRDISFVYFTQPISSISEMIHSPMSLVMTWGSCVVHKSHTFLYQDNAMFGVIPWLRICMSMSYILLFLESDMITVHSWAAVSCPAALVSLALCLSADRDMRDPTAQAQTGNRGRRVSSWWIFIETKEHTEMSFDKYLTVEVLTLNLQE